MIEWLLTNEVLSACQKSYLRVDSAIEHVHILNRVLEKARTHAKDKNVAWLDVSNAFGAIPHPAIEASGAVQDFFQAV